MKREYSKCIVQLQNGSIGIVPTDTLYGLVCDAHNTDAVSRLYGLKNRERKPGTIVAASLDQLVDIGFKARYLKAVESFWPGPISIVIPCVDLSYLHLGVGSVAVRITADKEFAVFLTTVGPLLTTSANPPDTQPADTIEIAQKYFGDQVDFYIDGGDLAGRKPSTVIRVVDDAVEVLRLGAYTMNDYE